VYKQNMKKLLLITDMFPHRYSPFSEVFVQQQAEELAKHYEVRVIATRFRYKYSVELDERATYQVTYVYMPVIEHFYPSLILIYWLLAIPVINRMINDWKPDLIHVHDYKHVPELLLLHDCLQQYKIPRYLTVHNIRTHPIMVKSKCFRWFYRLSVRRAYNGWAHIFTVNDKIRDILSRDANVTQITNIGNAIGPIPEIATNQLKAFKDKLSDDRFKIISVGNLKKEKGFDLLIEAVSILAKKNYAIQVFIVGKGEEKDRLIAEIDRLGLSDQVFLTGDLGNDIVRNLYPLFDAFILASYSESFGIVYIEAMFAGLPVIGVRGQGIDGIIQNGVNGLLVNPRDAGDLSDKIEYIITNIDLVKEMAEKGQLLVKQNFQLTQLINKIISTYEQ
jgi:teichuronic acid biosynthesis glycosyltransferase TuaC